MRRRDSSNDQLREACNGDGRAAALLAHLIGIYEYKLKRNYESMVMDFGRAELASKLFCSESTIKRASDTLVELGYLVVHQPSRGFDRRLLYELNYEKVKSIYQDMPLFGTLNADLVKVTKSSRSGWPDRSGQDDQIISITNPSTNTITTIKQNDGDDDRTNLLEELRAWKVGTERAEHWLTMYTRQLIREGIKYVRARMSKESIGNPAGKLFVFLQDPAAKGYERDAHNCWHPVVAKPKASQSMYKDYTAERLKKQHQQASGALSGALAGGVEGVERNGTSTSIASVDVQPRPGTTGEDRRRGPCQDIRGRDRGTRQGLLGTSGRQDGPQVDLRNRVVATD